MLINYLAIYTSAQHMSTTDKINILDLKIIRKTTNMEIDIYRKPTTTGTTVKYLSNHSMQHKLAAYRYHINRMFSLPLTKEREIKEWKPIQTSAYNKNFSSTLVTKLKYQIKGNKIQ
jgi:hypothetical protein